MAVAVMLNFDTHHFIKSFVAAKNDEQKAEIIAETFVKIRSESETKIDESFEKSKNELATKSDLKSETSSVRADLKSEISSVRADLKDLELRLTNKLYILIGGSVVFLTTMMLGVLPLFLK